MIGMQIKIRCKIAIFQNIDVYRHMIMSLVIGFGRGLGNRCGLVENTQKLYTL